MSLISHNKMEEILALSNGNNNGNISSYTKRNSYFHQRLFKNYSTGVLDIKREESYKEEKELVIMEKNFNQIKLNEKKEEEELNKKRGMRNSTKEEEKVKGETSRSDSTNTIPSISSCPCPSLQITNLFDEKEVTIIMLLAQVCALYDPTPKTFVLNVLRLYEMNIIESIAFLYDLGLVSQSSSIVSNAMNKRADALMANDGQIMEESQNINVNPIDILETIKNSSLDDKNIEYNVDDRVFGISRYQRDFLEIQSLGSGGFGMVFMAQNRIDKGFYAIKKVTFANEGYRNPYLHKVLREVRCLAKCDHQNVSRYYSAWLEPSWVHVAGGTSPSDMLSDVGQSQKIVRHNQADSIDESFFSGGDLSSQSSDIIFEDSQDQCLNNTIELHNKKVEQKNSYFYRITLYIQMSLCAEQTLQDWINRRNRDKLFSENVSMSLFLQILEGLCHIHGNGIIHRDLKPSNIFLGMDGNLKIGDFGLSKILDEANNQHMPTITAEDGCIVHTTLSSNRNSSPSHHTEDIGTFTYASPEQMSQGIYDEKTDCYSLGIILFELFMPFETSMERAKAIENLCKSPCRFSERFIIQFPFVASLIKSLLAPSESRFTSFQALEYWKQHFHNSVLSRHEEIDYLKNKISDQSKIIEEQRKIISGLQSQLSSQKSLPNP